MGAFHYKVTVHQTGCHKRGHTCRYCLSWLLREWSQGDRQLSIIISSMNNYYLQSQSNDMLQCLM